MQTLVDFGFSPIKYKKYGDEKNGRMGKSRKGDI
jgi:hypothetical protein